MNGCSITIVVRKPESLGEKHEGARKRVVEFTMPYPVFPEFVVFREIIRPRPVDMLENLVEEVTNDNRASEATVWVALEGFVEGTGCGHLAVAERCLGAWKMRSYLFALH